METTDTPGQPSGRGLAILIGINDYANDVPPLRNAVRDVQAVAQVLHEQHGYAVRLVLDQQATLSGLRSLLSQLPAEVAADTRLVLYFAGHGIVDETDEAASGPQGFLIPQDARQADMGTFLPMAELQTWLGKLPCRHLLVVLDCCFAGAFRWSKTRSLRVRPATLYRERYERYLRDSAWQVITSAASDERALDAVAGGKLGRRGPDHDHSPFAAALCAGLRGDADLTVAGLAGDGVIVANELHVYLESRFSLLELKLGRPVQKPLLWSLDGRDKGQFIFFTPGRPVALPSALELTEANNPYRGLQPYDENDEKRAALFFGRNEVIEQLNAQVSSQPLTVVSGVSGGGKSSLVRIGLLRRLRRSADWCVPAAVRPGSRPLSALAAVSAELGAATEPDLAAAIRKWRASSAEKKLLLVIDQLEELVTMGAEPAEQQRFLRSIADALSQDAGQLHVVMTLRSDFEPHFSELLSPKPDTQVRFPLRPLSRLELRQVIEGPASERVLSFEPPRLVDQLIDEVAEMPGALPLLSFTMSELYRAYVRSGRSDRCLTESDYRALGGVDGALCQRADEIFHSLDAAHQGTLLRVMLRMVSLQAGEMARRRVPLSELEFGAGHPEEARKQTVLARLKETRLVVSGTDNEGTPYVEPAHDKLVLGWPQLWRHIQQEQATLPISRLLTQEASSWVRGDRKSDQLWSGNPSLPLVVDLQRKLPERFNAQEGEFIRRSAARRRNRFIGLGLAIATALVMLTTAALLYRQNTQKATLADANRLASQSESLRPRDIRSSVDSARKAVQLASSDTTWSSFLGAYYHMENGWQIERRNLGAGGIQTLSFSDSGQDLLIATYSSLQVVNIDLTSKTESLPNVTGIVGAFYRPGHADQILIAYGHEAAIWSLRDKKWTWKADEHNRELRSASWSGNGERVLVLDNNGKARIFSPQSPHPIASCDTGPAAALSFDGHRVALVSADTQVKIELVEQNGCSATGTAAAQPDTIKQLAFSPDGKFLAVAFGQSGLRLIRTTQQKLEESVALEGHLQQIYSLQFSPDSSMLVSASDDGAALVWSAREEGSRSSQEWVLAQGRVPRVPLLKQLRHSSDAKSEIPRSNGRGRARTNELDFATFSPTGTLVATGLIDGSIALWFLGGDVANTQRFPGVNQPFRYIPNQHWLTSLTGDENIYFINPLGTGNGILKMDTAVPSENKPKCAALSPDGSQLIAGSELGELSHWKFDGKENWTQDWKQKIHSNQISSCSFSPDGRLILSTGLDGKIALLDAGDLSHSARPLPYAGEPRKVFAGAFSQDGKSIAAAGDLGKLLVFSSAGAPELEVEAAGQITAVAFDPTDRRVLTVHGLSDSEVRLWTRQGKLLAQLKHPKEENVDRAIFSRDGAWIISGTMTGVVRVWDVSEPDLTGRELLKWQAHNGWLQTLALSASGDQLLTAAEDGRVRLWTISAAAIESQLARLVRGKW